MTVNPHNCSPDKSVLGKLLCHTSATNGVSVGGMDRITIVRLVVDLKMFNVSISFLFLFPLFQITQMLRSLAICNYTDTHRHCKLGPS